MAPSTILVRVEQVERRHIQSVLQKTDWVIEGDRGAAKVLDLHPNTLRSRMKKLGIDRAALNPALPATKSRSHEGHSELTHRAFVGPSESNSLSTFLSPSKSAA